MEALLALTAVREGLVLVLITVLAAPLAGVWFLRAGDAWRKIGRGPFSIGLVKTGGAPGAMSFADAKKPGECSVGR